MGSAALAGATTGEHQSRNETPEPDARGGHCGSWWWRAACSKYWASMPNCQPSLQFANISRVVSDVPPSDTDARADTVTPQSAGLGPALRRAWLGYQLRLDAAMADAGFGERRFPDGRVLRLCSGQAGSTISAIGRELGITRQGASKVVGQLRDRGYVAVADSADQQEGKVGRRHLPRGRLPAHTANGGAGDRGRVAGRPWTGGVRGLAHLARGTRPR